MDLACLIHAFMTCSTSASILSPKVLMTSSCSSSTNTNAFQSISGWNVANQGYPRMISSSPRSVTKNHISLTLGPHQTWRSTKLVMAPALLCVPSIFQMVLSFGSFRLLIFMYFRTMVLMKLSVASESTRTSFLAFWCEDNRVGICRLLCLHANTLFIPKIVCTQTDGVAHLKNPYRHLLPPYPPYLPRLPLWGSQISLPLSWTFPIRWQL